MKPHYSIKKMGWFIFIFAITVCFQSGFAQTTTALPDTSKITYNQVSTALKLYAYPAKGQSQQQQKSDEVECYKWAMEQSGIDPLNLPKDTVVAQTGRTGGAAKGAAKGAAAGAAVGAIAGDDAGEGAAIGAAAGGA